LTFDIVNVLMEHYISHIKNVACPLKI